VTSLDVLGLLSGGSALSVIELLLDVIEPLIDLTSKPTLFVEGLREGLRLGFGIGVRDWGQGLGSGISVRVGNRVRLDASNSHRLDTSRRAVNGLVSSPT